MLRVSFLGVSVALIAVLFPFSLQGSNDPSVNLEIKRDFFLFERVMFSFSVAIFCKLLREKRFCQSLAMLSRDVE